MMAALTESLRHSPQLRCAKTPEHRNYEIGHGKINGHVQTPEFKPQSSWKKSSMIVHTPVIPVLGGSGRRKPGVSWQANLAEPGAPGSVRDLPWKTRWGYIEDT